jgi:hypothetical protein
MTSSAYRMRNLSPGAERSDLIEGGVTPPSAPAGHDAEEKRMKKLILEYLRGLPLSESSVWDEISDAYPGAVPFVMAVGTDALVVSDESFEARAEALIRVPAVRANGERDMAPLTLPVDIQGHVRDGKIAHRMAIAGPVNR